MSERFTNAELEMIINMWCIAEAGDTSQGDYCWTDAQYKAANRAANKAHEILAQRKLKGGK